MLIISGYDKYRFTKIVTQIYMIECPSDYSGMRYFVNIDVDSYTQSKCYIDNHFIERITIERIPVEDEYSAKWNLSMIVQEGLDETEVFTLLRQYCAIITKRSSIYVLCEANGFSGFDFDELNVRRSYSEDGITYVDDHWTMSASLEMETISTISQNVFTLKYAGRTKSSLIRQIEDAYVSALKSGDAVSRYILLYRVIEIIKGTEEMKLYRAEAEATLKSRGISQKEWQSLALCEFIRKELGVSKYRNNTILTASTMKQIILVRNDLAHDADQSRVSRTLYDHFIPIVQAILRKRRKTPSETRCP